LAAAIKSAHHVDAQLIAGSGGVFDVKLNGRLVFSKGQVGRFPENDEILKLLPGPG